MKYTNRDLYSAYLALVDLGVATKPTAERLPDGQSVVRQPVLSPLPAGIAFRLALNRNHLQPVARAIEEQREELLAAIRGQSAPDAKAVEDYNKRMREVLDQEVDWSSPASVTIQQFGDRGLPDEWLAAWIAVGIVVDAESKEAAK
jgi:hypothetical protein